MKKFLLSIFAAASLAAAPQAVVFDWGNVLAFVDRDLVVEFVSNALQLSKAEFEEANHAKRKAVKGGKSEIEFWVELAQSRGVELSDQWPAEYQETLKQSIGADESMYEMVEQLKENQIVVGLLSNVDNRYVNLIRNFGFYEPFDPCLLSCEIGLEKPDPKIYELLLEKLPYSPEEIVFIDDKAENIEAARAFGIDGIVFESAGQIRKELISRGLL